MCEKSSVCKGGACAAGNRGTMVRERLRQAGEPVKNVEYQGRKNRTVKSVSVIREQRRYLFAKYVIYN